MKNVVFSYTDGTQYITGPLTVAEANRIVANELKAIKAAKAAGRAYGVADCYTA